MNDSRIEEIELSIEDAKKNIRLLEALSRLQNNKDFQLLIEDEFFVQGAARAVSMKSSPNFQEPHQQRVVDNVIVGIGQLQQFFNKVYQIGQMSRRSLEEYEEEHQRLLAGGDDE